MLVDVHAHLCFEQFQKDIDQVIEESSDIHIINSIINLQNIEYGFEIQKKHSNISSTIGLSPSDLDKEKFDGTIAAVRGLKEFIVGIGEVGLDYYWIKSEKEREYELQVFQKFIDLSKEFNLPLVLHTRDAESDTIKIIRENNVNALMHCFSGSIEEMFEAVELGCLISIPTNVTFVKKRKELAKKVPLDFLVLETDSPYLSPVQGERNIPSNIKISCEKIAEITGHTYDEVATATTENACKFFNLKDV